MVPHPSMTLLGMTAILESTFIYLKAENAFGFLFLFHFIFSNPEIIQCAGWKRQMQEAVQQDYPHLTPEEVTELADSKTNVFKSL
jgi:hypothetical protein